MLFMNLELKNLINDNVNLYQKLINDLVKEKSEINKGKKEKICNLAKDLFIIKDTITQNTVDDYIENIANCKPGRKLIKALHSKKCKFKVKQTEEFKYDNFKRTIGIHDQSNPSCYTINERMEEQLYSHPKWISFAHELIHAFHYSEDEVLRLCCDIFPDMDNLEEQWTITGYKAVLFEKKENLKPIDVLSENAFNLAVGIPMRINHKGSYETKLDQKEISLKENEKIYYEWMKKTLESINTIPKNKEEDQEFLLEYLGKYPAALKNLKGSLKNDPEFMYKLFSLNENTDVLEHSDELCKNEEFVLKIMRKDTSFIKKCSELFEKKEFLLKAIKVCPGLLRYLPHLSKNEEFILSAIKTSLFPHYTLRDVDLANFSKEFIVQLINSLKEKHGDKIDWIKEGLLRQLPEHLKEECVKLF